MESGGTFHTKNAMIGLNPPRINAAQVNCSSEARDCNDCRKLIFNPSNGASIPLSNALPTAVSNKTIGSFNPE